MTDPTHRTLRLLSLLQGRRGWGGADLADRLGTSVRTLRRDVERLRELGYPVSPGSGWCSRTGWCRWDGAGT